MSINYYFNEMILFLFYIKVKIWLKRKKAKTITYLNLSEKE